MGWLKRIGFSLGCIGFIACASAVLLFNRPTLGWQLLSVPTGSMRPTMPPGSLVLVHSVPDSSLRVGDVITHTNPLTMRTTITHRIIKIYKLDGKIPTIVTKGDANPSPDVPVVAGLVQGRMIAHVPLVGEVFMWAKTWIGIVALIYLPALLIEFEETRRLAAYLRRMKLYRLEGWHPRRAERRLRPVPATAMSVVMALLVASIGWQTAAAVAAPLQSNIVALSPNQLATAKIIPPPNTGGSCNQSSTVTSNNTTNVTTTSDNTSVTGVGSATSGSASSTNSQTNMLNVQNKC